MDIERCKKYALNLLSLRMYTCSEVFERLIKKGAQKDDAESVVAQLMKLGVLDDRKYAEYYISDGISLGNKGLYRIKQELHKKGIAASVVDEAAENSAQSVLDSLISYARMKFGENEEYSYREYTKIKAHLARRGYSYSEINECLEVLGIKFSRSEEY